jgi:hypothetical protein
MVRKLAKEPEIQDNSTFKAEGVLEEAMAQISTKSSVHGDTEPSFQMIAELWSVYTKHGQNVRPESWVSPHDVAQMMILVKIARSVYGHSSDNYVDEAGYAALAALFRNREKYD